MRWPAVAILPLLLLAGCGTEEPAARHVDLTGGQQTFNQGALYVPVSCCDLYAVVNASQTDVRLIVKEYDTDSGWDSPREVFVRVVDANGEFHDSTTVVQPAGVASAIHGLDVPLPGPGPHLVYTEGVPLAHVERPLGQWNASADAVLAGDPALVGWSNTTVLVEYAPLDDPVGAVGQEPARDEATFTFGPDVLHWSFLWEGNLNGNVTLTTPSGRELALWEYAGLRVTGGHVSNGANPLEIGDWTLTLEGVGWFRLHLDRAVAKPTLWSQYGIASPV